MKQTLTFLLPCLMVLALNAPSSGQSQPLKIILDYRFDGGYFSQHPERKVPLEYAAGLWERVLKTPRSIEAGTTMTLRLNHTDTKTTKVVFDRKMDGFVIFVYAHDYAMEVDDNGRPTPSNSKGYGFNYGKNLAAGYLTINTNAARTWFFDQTPETADDIPIADHFDLITTVVHEFGHILGFARNRQAPFVKSFGKKDERFCGPAAMRVNDGKPVPLEFDSSHFRGDWWNDRHLAVPPIDRYSMHTGDPVQGYRALMTPLDVAVMEDIGWKVDYSAVPNDPYFIKSDNRKSDAERHFGIAKHTLNPAGLWIFDNRESAGSAIVGYPLRYSPPKGATGGIAGLFREKELRVPKGGWLYCVPGLKASGAGGKESNRYTLVLDVRLPEEGTFYCLYNTNPFSENDGECFISRDGLLGLGNAYGTEKLEARRWYRLGIVIDADKKSRRYYINGAFSHESTDVEMDGRFSIYNDRARTPVFSFFGDDDGEDGDIDVRRLAVYDTPLNDRQMQKLGNSDNSIFGL
jgi:hypothetical protein